MIPGTRAPWLALGLLVVAAMLYGGAVAALALGLALPACPLKAWSGIPCATCGLSRCILAAAQGHWAEAFHWHPVAFLLGAAAPLVLAWDLRRAWKGEDLPQLPDSLPLRLGVAGLLAGTWLLQIARGI